MRAPALASISAFVLITATVVWAQSALHPSRPDAPGPSRVSLAQAPVPIRWMPDWLMHPLEKAIADAGDPRERKSKR